MGGAHPLEVSKLWPGSNKGETWLPPGGLVEPFCCASIVKTFGSDASQATQARKQQKPKHFKHKASTISNEKKKEEAATAAAAAAQATKTNYKTQTIKKTQASTISQQQFR